MSKKPRKKGKQDRIASNAEWLNTSLESTPLDLDALSSMPLDEVKSDLKKYKVQTSASFIKELNAKLPDSSPINAPREAASKKRRSRKSTTAPSQRDRKPVQRTQRTPNRIFTIRNAFALSAVIVGVALFGPLLLDLINTSSPEPASNTITHQDSTEETGPPTHLEFTFPNIKIRGVTYTLENFKGLVPQSSPLPSNPDTLDKTFTFLATIDSDGHVIGLRSEQTDVHPFEKAIMDSLLKWRFYGGEEAEATNGTIKITYKTK